MSEKRKDSMNGIRGQALNRKMNRAGTGPGGLCVCPHCDYSETHRRGEPCNQKTCPRCGVRLIHK